MQASSPPPEATLFLVSDDLAVMAPPRCDAMLTPPTVEVRSLAAFERPLQPSVRELGLLGRAPWVRPSGSWQLR